MAAPFLLRAPATWQRVACLSDVHLHAADPDTARLWQRTLQHLTADAIFVLGDLFEAWVGDDALRADPALDADVALMQWAAGVLAQTASRMPVYVMHGNRDFLLGVGFAAATGATLLPDPTVLSLGHTRWLLSHGDAWCTDDTDYQRFRAEVRAPAWQRAFLARPLAQRLSQARAMRQGSRIHQAARAAAGEPPSDVDPAVVAQACRAADANGVVHGHTHRPAAHRLGDGTARLVLSDWHAGARPPRAEVLLLDGAGGWQVQRIADLV